METKSAGSQPATCHVPAILVESEDAMGMIESVPDLRHQEIAKLAYEIWERNGLLAGSAEQDWLEAEQTVDSLESENLPFGALSFEADE